MVGLLCSTSHIMFWCIIYDIIIQDKETTMRMNFYELLDNMKFNIGNEYSKLYTLLFVEKSIHSIYGGSRTLARYINDEYFRKLPFRKTFTSIEDLMERLSIKTYSEGLDQLLTFCEFIFAILPSKLLNGNNQAKEQADTIKANIKDILESTNNKLILRPNSDNEFIIVEDDKAVTLAAELIDDIDVAFDILQYKHRSLKGNLPEKRKLLTSVAAYLEPILRNKSLSSAGYKTIESDMGFILNNFHIRHNNKEGSTAKDYIVNITDDELENWYDKAYNMAVLVVLINNHVTVENEILDLKQKHNW